MRMRLLASGLLCVLLAGCGRDDLEDVREFVKTAHADKKPRVEPLPEVKTQEAFVYTPANLTDPFSAFNLKPQTAKGAPGGVGGPDPNRRKELLEDYPLDSLKMVGTLTRGRQSWAIVQAPDGAVYRAKVGDHLGQNYGQIVRVTEEKVELIELIQGSLGDWVEREASIALLE